MMFVAEFRKLLKQMENCEYMLLIFSSIETTTSFPVSCTVSRTFSQTNIISSKLKSSMIFSSKCPKNQFPGICDNLNDNVTVKQHKHLKILSFYLILCFHSFFFFNFFLLGWGIRVTKCPRLFKFQHEKSGKTKQLGRSNQISCFI